MTIITLLLLYFPLALICKTVITAVIVYKIKEKIGKKHKANPFQ